MSQALEQVTTTDNGMKVRQQRAYRFEHMLNPRGHLLPQKIDIHAPFGGLDEFRERGFLIVSEHKSTRPEDPVISVSMYDRAGNIITKPGDSKRRAQMEKVRVTAAFFDEMKRRQAEWAVEDAQRRENSPTNRTALDRQVAAQHAAQAALDLQAAQQAVAAQHAEQQPQNPTNEQRGKGR